MQSSESPKPQKRNVIINKKIKKILDIKFEDFQTRQAYRKWKREQQNKKNAITRENQRLIDKGLMPDIPLERRRAHYSGRIMSNLKHK